MGKHYLTFSTRTALLTFALALPLLAGCASGPSQTLGTPLETASLVAVRDLKPDKPIQVKGTMIEKCPVAGCWFMLRDKSGVIKVDTKGAGFVVTDVPLNTEVTVTGTPDLKGERRIVASGLRY